MCLSLVVSLVINMSIEIGKNIREDVESCELEVWFGQQQESKFMY